MIIDSNSIIYCFILLYPDVINRLCLNLQNPKKAAKKVSISDIVVAFRTNMCEWAQKIIIETKNNKKNKDKNMKLIESIVCSSVDKASKKWVMSIYFPNFFQKNICY